MSRYPGHHPSPKEMQLWQQHLMLKQLQELQRQRQLQQLDQRTRQQSFLSQAASRQDIVNQLPSVLNGLPINDTSSYMLANDIMGGEPKTPISSHMFTAENTNWAQTRTSLATYGSNRHILTDDHGQVMHPMGLLPAQRDQSLYGSPGSGSSSFLSQNLQLQGMPSNFSNATANTVRDQLEKTSLHSMASNPFQMDQCVPEQTSQGFQGNFPAQSLSRGNFEHVDRLEHNNHSQEFHNGQGQVCGSNNIEEKVAMQVGPSRGVTSLDPTEAKILFGTDDDGNWGTSLGRIDNMGTGGNMQDLLEGDDQFGAFPSLHSGSWSALMQEAVQATSSDKGLQEEWSGLSIQNTETSLRNPSTSTMHNSLSNYQSSWDNGRNLHGASSATLKTSTLFNAANSVPPICDANAFQRSHDSLQQSSNTEQRQPFDPSHQPKPIPSDGLASKMQPIHNDGLPPQMQPNVLPHGFWSKQMHAGKAEGNLQNNQDSSPHKDQLSSPNVTNFCRQPDASFTGWNRSLATHGGNTSDGLHNNRIQAGSNISGEVAPLKSDISSPHYRSAEFSTSNFASVLNSNNLNVNEYEHRLGQGRQVQGSSVNSADPSPSMSDSQTSSGMSGWKSVGSRKIQSHTVEKSMNMEPVDSPKDTAYSQFSGQGISNMGKVQSADMLRITRRPEESQYGGKKPTQSSHNMLELLHKVDNSRDTGSVARLSSSDPNSVHDTDEAAVADGSVSQLHRQQSPVSQGSGLHLGSPSHRQEVQNHVLHSQTPLLDFQQRQAEAVARGSDLVQSAFCGTDHSQHHIHEASQKEILDGRPTFSAQNCKELPQLISQGNFSSVNSSTLSHMGRQFQLQRQQQLLRHQQMLQMEHRSSLTGREVMNQSGNMNSGSLLRNAQRAMFANQTGQTLSPTMAAKILPFRLESLANAHGQGSHVPGQPQPTFPAFYHRESSMQQLPSMETGQALQHAGFSTILQNVGDDNAPSQQVSSGVPPQKLIRSEPQSIMPTIGRDKSTGGVQMHDDQGNKRGSDLSILGTCSQNSQQLADADILPGEEPLRGTDSERVNDIPKTASASEEQGQMHLGHQSQYDINKGKLAPGVATSDNDVGHYGHSGLQSNIQQPNYSLLQQMQTMKDAGADASRREGKSIKGEYGYNPQIMFPSDARMLSFSTSENEVKDAERNGQLVSGESHPDVQSQTKPPTSTSSFIGRRDHPLLTPQMARSWFEQYRKYKNGQILARYADQKSSNAVSQPYIPAEASARVDSAILTEQRTDTSQFNALSQILPGNNEADNESSQLPLPLGIPDDDHMDAESTKHDIATSEHLPWHQVVAPGVKRLQNISLAERDWTQATNRLTEKVDDVREVIEDYPLVPQARKRLVLTTQLMQQLLSPVPAPILTEKVTSAYESVTYFLAKSALGDACSLLSSSGGDSGEQLDDVNRTSKKRKTPEKASDNFFSNVVEGFIGRSTKLESEFSRLEKRTSILDVRLEWQEIERISLVNQLGKFHGRTHADGVESSTSNSLTSQNYSRRIFPQRYVTALSMSGRVPEGVVCLTL